MAEARPLLRLTNQGLHVIVEYRFVERHASAELPVCRRDPPLRGALPRVPQCIQKIPIGVERTACAKTGKRPSILDHVQVDAANGGVLIFPSSINRVMSRMARISRIRQALSVISRKRSLISAACRGRPATGCSSGKPARCPSRHSPRSRERSPGWRRPPPSQ